MKEENNSSSTINDVLSRASCLVTLAFPIVGAFMDGKMAYLWCCAWIVQTFILLSVISVYKKRKTELLRKLEALELIEKTPSKEEEDDQQCLELLPARSINFLREVANSKDNLVKNLDGSVSIKTRFKSRRDFDDLFQFGLIEESPSNALGETVFRVSVKGRRVLALAERSRS